MAGVIFGRGGSNQSAAYQPIGRVVSPDFTNQAYPPLKGLAAPWGPYPPLPVVSAAFSVDFTNSPSLPSQLTLTRASSATYFDVNGVMQTATSNVARFDYAKESHSARGLFLEEGRTNSIANKDISTWTITNGNDIVIGSAVASVDGGTSAYPLTPNAAAGFRPHMVHGSGSVTTGSPIVFSCYVKANGYSQIALRESGVTGHAATFNLVTKQIIYNGPFSNGMIEPAGNGVFRVSALYTPSGSATYTMGILPIDNNWAGTPADPFSYSFTADGTSGIIVQFPQMEVTSSATQYLPTSYIYTSGTAASRSADIVSSTDATFLTYKGWVVETEGMQPDAAATMLGINTVIGLGYSLSDVVTTADGGTQSGAVTVSPDQVNRAVLAWDSTPRVSITSNGNAVTTAANTPVTPTTLYFGNTNNGASGFLNGRIRMFGAYTTLADADMPSVSYPGATFTAAAATVSGDGASTGVGTATAVGASTAASTGASSGTGTATAVGASTATATAAASGTGAATAVGVAIAAAVGSAAGAATVTAVGKSTANSVGASSGTGTATAVGAATAASTAASAGAGTATAVGASTAASTGAASGAATVTAVGTGIIPATGTAAGSATATAAGAALAIATGAASGAATVTAVGTAIANSVGASSGTGTATGVGKSTANSVGVSAGTGTATAVGASTAASTGAASGAATVTAVGQGVAAAVGSAAGAATVTAVGASTAASAGSSSGTGTATGVGKSTANSVSVSAGTGTATAVGASTAASVGSSSGTGTATAVGATGTIALASGQATVSGVGASTAAATGTAAGAGTATAVGTAVKSAVGTSSGAATVTGVSSSVTTTSAVGASAGTATVSGVGAATAAATGTSTGVGTATGQSTAVATVSAVGAAAGAGAAYGVGATIFDINASNVFKSTRRVIVPAADRSITTPSRIRKVA